MEVLTALRQIPAFKELHKKGKSRTPAENAEYRKMLDTNPLLENIPRYEAYAQLAEMSGRTAVQEAGLQQFLMSYPKIVEEYNKRKLGKGRSRRRRAQKRKSARRTRRR